MKCNVVYIVYFSVRIGPEYRVFDHVIVTFKLVAIVKAMGTLFTCFEERFYAIPAPHNPQYTCIGFRKFSSGRVWPNLFTDATRGLIEYHKAFTLRLWCLQLHVSWCSTTGCLLALQETGCLVIDSVLWRGALLWNARRLRVYQPFNALFCAKSFSGQTQMPWNKRGIFIVLSNDIIEDIFCSSSYT